jgi:hypothetical protein
MRVKIKKSSLLEKKLLSCILSLSLLLGIFAPNSIEAKAAGMPAALAATGVTSTSFTANWVSDGESTYFLDVATDSNFTNILAGYDGYNAGTTASCTLTGLSSVTNYFYRVSTGEGTYSNIVFVKTPAKNGEYSSSNHGNTQGTSIPFPHRRPLSCWPIRLTPEPHLQRHNLQAGKQYRSVGLWRRL